MGYSYKIDKERRLVIASIWDMIDKESVLEFRRALIADPDFNPEFNQLAEYQTNTKLEITSQEVDELRLSDPFSPRSRRAFVAHSDLLYGYVRMYSSLMEANGFDNIKVFRSMEEAEMWIEQK
jgi:hypothetical protein